MATPNQAIAPVMLSQVKLLATVSRADMHMGTRTSNTVTINRNNSSLSISLAINSLVSISSQLSINSNTLDRAKVSILNNRSSHNNGLKLAMVSNSCRKVMGNSLTNTKGQLSSRFKLSLLELSKASPLVLESPRRIINR
jgi:hypothetical protein